MSYGIYQKHLRYKIIRPILQKCECWSLSAENLLIGTAAHESLGGKYLVQLEGGPARGLYGMEALTFQDIRITVLPRLNLPIDFFIPNDPDQLIWDHRLATIMCRAQFMRFEEPLPKFDDIEGLASYYKKYYNSIKGKATTNKWINDFKNYLNN